MIITDPNKKTQIQNAIKARWHDIDSKENNSEREIQCRLCGATGKVKDLNKLYSDCIFFGGRLERYRCSICDVIFGPLKMFDLSEEQFNKEYEEIYTIYEEGDTSNNEIIAFESMHPSKNKTYLDFGCGSNPRALLKLRKSGWNNVYGYEPYSDSNHSFIIKNREELNKIKFDGVFSNNVIEHFRNPIESLKDIKNMLSENGLMAHATTNHIYAYEYSRFHLYFYVGKSMHILAKNSGLSLIDAKNYGHFGNFVFKK